MLKWANHIQESIFINAISVQLCLLPGTLTLRSTLRGNWTIKLTFRRRCHSSMFALTENKATRAARGEQYDCHRPLPHFVRPDSTLTMADRYLPAAVSQWNDAPPQQLPRESRGRAPPVVITGRSRHAPQQPVAGERSLSSDRERR